MDFSNPLEKIVFIYAKKKIKINSFTYLLHTVFYQIYHELPKLNNTWDILEYIFKLLFTMYSSTINHVWKLSVLTKNVYINLKKQNVWNLRSTIRAFHRKSNILKRIIISHIIVQVKSCRTAIRFGGSDGYPIALPSSFMHTPNCEVNEYKECIRLWSTVQNEPYPWKKNTLTSTKRRLSTGKGERA